MPRPGTQCDNCSHGPLEQCHEECPIKELIDRMNKMFGFDKKETNDLGRK